MDYFFAVRSVSTTVALNNLRSLSHVPTETHGVSRDGAVDE